MPAYSGKRSHTEMSKKWPARGGRGGNQRRDDRRGGAVINRRGGALLSRNTGMQGMMSPWENGLTPGMQTSYFNQDTFSQPSGSNFYISGDQNSNFQSSNFSGYGGGSNKMRRVERMGGFDDHRGRGLLPSPANAPLLGFAPSRFPPQSRGVPEYLQQRMGTPWDTNFRPGANSGYYPSNRGRQDNSRKFLKARRPLNKAANSKGGGGRDFKMKPKGAATKKVDKETPPNSKELKNKQGAISLQKSERTQEEKSKPKDDEQKMETNEEEKEEKVDGSEEGKKTEVKMEEEKGEDGKKEKEEKKKKRPQEDQFPVKALYCHICQLDSFSSKQGYIRHLQGITHAKMAELFHAKNAATLELLNISAKLAEMRQRDKVLRRTGKKSQPVPKTTERALVQKWLKVGSCCGTKYKSPFGMEEHKLSVQHLKNVYPAKSEEKPKEEGVEEKKEEEEEEDSHDVVVRASAILEAAKKEAKANPINMQNLPVYSPSEKTGLEYVIKVLRFRCIVCKGQMFRNLETHCQAHSHYDNIASHLNKLEDAKLEEERKEKEKKEKELKEKVKEEDKKANEEKEEKEIKKEEEKVEEVEEEKVEEEEEEQVEEDIEENVEEEVMEVEGEAKATEEVESDDGGGEDFPSDYITVDCSEDFNDEEKSDEEEIDEDVVPLGEDEVRILSDSRKKRTKPEPQPEAEADEDIEENIFEEVGEKIDLDNSKDEEKTPRRSRRSYTPRRGRGRGRARPRWGK